MPAQYIYKVSTSSNVDFSARVRAYQTSMSANAEQGSVAMSQVIVDDDDAGINIVGLHQFDWKESSESSNSRTIHRGFIADRTVTRGLSNKVGQGRRWTVSVADMNSIISRRIMLGSDANRPAETDLARVQWLMGTSEFNLVTDTSLVSIANTVPMDAADYRNQTCQDILDDVSQQSGKNFFIWLNEIPATPTYGLFYDFPDGTAYPSTIRLSNVLSDVDSSTTFAVSEGDTKLVRDPGRVYSGVVEPYVGGQVYVQDESIATAFQRRDTTAPSVNVRTASAANARALRYIQDAASEDDVITTSYQVPLAKVNRLMPGMLVSARFSHLPGYNTFSNMRVLNRTVTAESEEFYRVMVDLSGVASAGGTDVLVAFVYNNASEPNDISTNLWTRLYYSGDFCASPVGCGAGPPTGQGVGVWVRNVVAGESAIVLSCDPGVAQGTGAWVYQLSGVVGGASGVSLAQSASNQIVLNGAAASITTSAATRSVLFGTVAWGKVGYDGGWCVGGGEAFANLTTTAGIELVNKGKDDTCAENSNPWAWQAYTTGSGTLTATAQSHAGYLAASHAYDCGYKVGVAAVKAAIGPTFSIRQSASGHSSFNGARCDVALPSPP